MTFLRLLLTSFAVFWTLDCVTSFVFRIRYVTNRRNACVAAKEVVGVSSNHGRRLCESKGINGIFVDSVCSNRNRTALVRELLSNKSQCLSVVSR